MVGDQVMPNDLFPPGTKVRVTGGMYEGKTGEISPDVSSVVIANVRHTIWRKYLEVIEPVPPTPGVGQTFFARPNGSDSQSGSEAAPVQTLAKALSLCKAGDVVMLHAGTYTGDVQIQDRIMVSSYGDGQVTVAGHLWVRAHQVTLLGFIVDGHDTTPDARATLQVTGTGLIARNVIVTNRHTKIGWNFGVTTYGRADGFYLQDCEAWDCGTLTASGIGATNHQHGFYIEHATGGHMVRCVAKGNADRGIQFYPDAQDTIVEDAVLIDNDTHVMFAGGNEDSFGDQASCKNRVIRPTFLKSRRCDVDSYWPGRVGTGNTVEQPVSGKPSVGDQKGWTLIP